MRASPGRLRGSFRLSKRLISKLCSGLCNFWKNWKISTFSKLSAKFRQNFIKIWAKINEKNSKITNFANFCQKNAKNFDEKFLKCWGLSGARKHVNLVDLVKSFPTNIYLQNLASIQKRTSPVKFAHLAEKSGKGSISNLSTKALGRAWLAGDPGPAPARRRQLRLHMPRGQAAASYRRGVRGLPGD